MNEQESQIRDHEQGPRLTSENTDTTAGLTSEVQIVWFKRDLRLKDHTPIREALSTGGPLFLIYIFEPKFVSDAHTSSRHLDFIKQSIDDLNQQLAKHGGKLHCFFADPLDVFRAFSKHFTFTLRSHMETGLRFTYTRDLAVRDFIRKAGCSWYETESGGVNRSRKDRLNWSRQWHNHMKRKIIDNDWSKLNWLKLDANTKSVNQLLHQEPLSTVQKNNSSFQRGGESIAHQVLEDFLRDRHIHYSAHISKPLESRESCSRLSPYIAYGNLSIRQIYQSTLGLDSDQVHKKSLVAFKSRLRWQAHFIQKFEMEDRIEFENLNRGYDFLKKSSSESEFEAWKTGKTGFPMVDASMRCVIETGYLNFRMRALLVSFLTHHLFQHWKPGAIHLARQFLDFEPGIHYSQFQMQAGMTGINTIRIYNPIKQAADHDPDGVFIAQWCPELSSLPSPYRLEPWKMSILDQELYGFKLGMDYPEPIVDVLETGKKARQALWGLRSNDVVKKEKARILKKHTSNRFG